MAIARAPPTVHPPGGWRGWAWLGSGGAVPDLDVVGGSAHGAIAAELAGRSITLVADPAGVLPLHPRQAPRILAVMPSPADLTPADTSSSVAPWLGAALRTVYPEVTEIVVGQRPDAADIAAVRAAAGSAGAVVVGTIDCHRQTEQLALVEAISQTGVHTVAVAMRGPWDVWAYPAGVTALATYSILPRSLEALAQVLAGSSVAEGRLPVAAP